MYIHTVLSRKKKKSVEGDFVESLILTLSIFQDVLYLTLSNLLQCTPLVVEVYFLVLLHLKSLIFIV